MFLQPNKSDFILSMIKEVESHEERSHWTPIKNIEVNNKHKNKYGKHRNILSIWSFMRKRFPEGGFMKHKARLCVHELMKQ